MVFVRNESQDTGVSECVVRQAALAALRMHESQACEVSVLLTDDSDIQSLNRRYRDIDDSTDVLAFAMREGDGELLNPHLLGDVVISVPTAQRQALAHNHSLDVEVAHLTVHGILHLLGYDHQISADAAIMLEKQEAILRLI
ncbi:MAG: rRNA maturation RNase YbeY [Candidatus Poribacteria bacterium]|nr:rRNA maturation RNase YbeY [Candidatus Poribacteria bacterium]MDE0504578.1 rRNA maturation RNase YbeY [Candidatus Poribacteria bacterium]